MFENEEWKQGVFFGHSAFMPGENWLVNNAVLIGEKGTIVWDTFAAPDVIHHQSNRYIPPVIAIYSHADWDHCWGTAGYDFKHVIAHQAALPRFEKEMTLERAKLRRETGAFRDVIRFVPPSITFGASLQLDLGNFSIEIVHFGGHTPDSIVGFVPEYGLLLVGDAAEEIPVINNPDDVDQWIVSLQKWIQHPGLQSILPGHGNLADRSLLEKNLKYLETIRSGKAPDVGELSIFYQNTHHENCRRMGIKNGTI